MPKLLGPRFCTGFGLLIPMALAPMALASGGALASACAGALGLVGGGYGDLAWTRREYGLALQAAETGRIGCGFITWKLDEDASALDWLLDLAPAQRPRAVLLSFGDPGPYAARIRRSGAALICQVQRLEPLPQAVQAGAQVIVAQGAEAGGHGMNALDGRATMTLVPEFADWLAAHAPETLLLAAGGIGDGRGLAGGPVLWATAESLAAQGAKELALQTDGDGTARSPVFDILRRKDWPAPYDFRAIRNALHRHWEAQIDALRAAPDAARAVYEAGVQAGDYGAAHATVGEVVGLVHDLPGAAGLITRIDRQARALLR